MAGPGFRACVVCGKVFRKKTNQVCCSRGCLHKRWQERKRTPPLQAPCIICGRTFQKLRNQRCCSPRCSKERKRVLDHDYGTLHSSEIVERVRQWRVDNRDEWLLQSVEKTNRRRAGPAMPPWINRDEIKQVYKDCPEGMVVVHEIPLRLGFFEGRPVCGLHVPWNLHYATQKENMIDKAATGAVQALKRQFPE